MPLPRSPLAPSLLAVAGSLLAGAAAAEAAPTVQQETLPARDRALQPVVEEVYRVGAASGPEWQLFGTRLEVAFDDLGRLYVVDPEAPRVVVVSPDGSHHGTLGRRGGGPGEFRSPAGVAYTRDGTVTVGDRRARRVTQFRPSGEVVATESVSGPRPHFPTLAPAPQGGVAYLPPSANWGDGPVPVYRMPLDGSGTVEVVHEARNPGGARMEQRSAGSGGWGFTFVTPPTFTPDVHLQRAGDVLAVVDGVDYRITLVGPDGTRILTRDLPAREVTDRDRRAAREIRRAELEEASGSTVGGARIEEMSDADIREALDAMTFAETLPAITDLRGRAGGPLLVARPGETAPGPGPVDVIDGDGTYLGTVPEWTLPDALGPDGLAAWIQEGDLGVRQVVVRRVRFRAR